MAPDDGGGVRPTLIMVTGGPAAARVDTEELAVLALRLEVAADHVDAATAAARTAASPLTYWDYVYAPSAPLAQQLFTAAWTAGLQPLAERLRTLAGDLRLQALWYDEADRRVSTAFRPGVWDYTRLLANLAPAQVRTAVRLTDVIMVTGHLGSAAVTLHQGTVPTAVAAQRHIAGLAEYLQYADPTVLHGFALVDGQRVDATAATPAERTALGLMGPTDTLGLVLRLGADYPGLDVTQVLAAPAATGAPDLAPVVAPALGPGLAPVVAPALGPGLAPVVAPALAPGLRALLPAAVPAPGRPVPDPPTGPGAALRRIGRLERQVRATGAGAVEILRTTDRAGRRHWTVVVPGSQDPGFGGPNPMDNQTNLRALGGVVSDMEVGVATAMEQAGIARDEPVAMVGHSQGGMVAARLVEDPLFLARYDVETLLTAGSPIGPVTVPGAVEVLSLEDLGDHTVGLDGQPNAATDHHVTVAVGDGGAPDPHHVTTYAGHADLLAGVDDPGVQAWLAANERAMGTAAPGARTESLVFEIARTR